MLSERLIPVEADTETRKFCNQLRGYDSCLALIEMTVSSMFASVKPYKGSENGATCPFSGGKDLGGGRLASPLLRRGWQWRGAWKGEWVSTR